LAEVKVDELSVAEATAYLWLTHRFVCGQLCSNGKRSRVLVLNGDQLLQAPEESLNALMRVCGLSLKEEQFQWLISHPTLSQYSKGLSRPYDAASRAKEMKELQNCWGREAGRRHGIRFDTRGF
jgi:hypothetical protein